MSNELLPPLPPGYEILSYQQPGCAAVFYWQSFAGKTGPCHETRVHAILHARRNWEFLTGAKMEDYTAILARLQDHQIRAREWIARQNLSANPAETASRVGRGEESNTHKSTC